MTVRFRSAIAALALAGLATASGPAAAQSFTPAQRAEIEAVVKDFLLKNPEALQEAVAELEKRQNAAEAEKAKSAIKDHQATLFNSQRHVVLGNPKGDVTLVEFFDYNCGYCKRALGDMMELLKNDPKLRVVLKEFPVLGESSIQAAQVAIAVRMQDKDGKKYLDFHQKLLSGRGQANKERAMAAAKDAGVDMARLERDVASPEIRATLEESFALAEALGLNGTPSYVVGNETVIGAVGTTTLKEKINGARCGKPSC